MSAPQKTPPQKAPQQVAPQQEAQKLRIRVVESVNLLLQEPAIRLTEKEGMMTLQVAVTGFSPDGFEMQITPDDILIQSERAREEQDETVNVHLSEFHEGRLFRQIHLPAPIEVGLTEARYHYGLLTITAPIATQGIPAEGKVSGSASQEQSQS